MWSFLVVWLVLWLVLFVVFGFAFGGLSLLWLCLRLSLLGAFVPRFVVWVRPCRGAGSWCSLWPLWGSFALCCQPLGLLGSAVGVVGCLVLFFLSYVSVMAIVLNLFSSAVWQSLVSPAVAAQAAPAVPKMVNGVRRDSVVCRWCIGCPLDGLCDSDQCGARRQSLYDYAERLAKHDPNSQWISRFPNLGVYINFLKKHGLL